MWMGALSKMKTSKFCAGATIGGQDVESIHQASKIATTGTPAAFLAKPDGTSGSEIGFWAAFALLVASSGRPKWSLCR